MSDPLMTGLAGVAVLSAVLVWPWGPRRVPRRPEVGAGGTRWRQLLDGRPGAPPLGRRVLVVGALVLAAGVLAAGRPQQEVIWSALPVAGLLGVVVLGRLEPARVRRRRVRLVLDLPQALDLLAAALTAGRPLRSAVDALVRVSDGPLAEDLGAVVAAVHLGRPEADAWSALRRHEVLGPVAIDLARSVDSGIRLVDLLHVHAQVARRRRQAELEALAKAVGVRAVLPLMCCFMPAFLLIGVVPIVGSVLGAALR